MRGFTKKGELAPRLAPPLMRAAFPSRLRANSFGSRFSESGEDRAITNHLLFKFAALREKHTSDDFRPERRIVGGILSHTRYYC